MSQSRLQVRSVQRKTDYRKGKRVNVSIKTFIYNHGLPVTIGITKNRSRDGTFVETSFQLDSKQSKIDIEFLAYHYDKTALYRFKAKLIHQCSDGLGFMIENFNPESTLPKLISDYRNL